MRIALTCIFACIAICSCRPAHISKSKPIETTSQFQPGQIWKFHTPTNMPSTALLKIIHVDIDPDEGPIIFIRVTGAQSHTWDENLYYLSEGALIRSVISLVETNSALTDSDKHMFSSYYALYLRGVQTHTFSRSSDMTAAEYLEHDAKN